MTGAAANVGGARRHGQAVAVLRGGLACVLVCGAVVGVAMGAAETKPKVPIGVDPGGVAVAVIGDGLDYTDARIAARLARDGEGELVGFDLVDRDRRPHAPPAEGQPEHPASVVLRHAPGVRIAPFRVAGQDTRQIAEAITMVARSPARIVLFQQAPPAQLLREAAPLFPQLSFKVPAPAADAGYPADVAGLGNVAIGCRDAAGDACATAAMQAALHAIVLGGKSAP